MINKKEINFVTLSLSHHIMQTMDPRKESVENENEENEKRAGAFFFGGLPTARVRRGGFGFGLFLEDSWTESTGNEVEI